MAKVNGGNRAVLIERDVKPETQMNMRQREVIGKDCGCVFLWLRINFCNDMMAPFMNLEKCQPYFFEKKINLVSVIFPRTLILAVSSFS